MKTNKKILLKFGVMTDNHLPGENSQNTLRTEKILNFFKQHSVDAVVNCGDISDRYSPEYAEKYRRMFENVFPDGTIDKLWIVAGHDTAGAADKFAAYSHIAEIFDCGGLNPVKIINGFTFIGISQEQDWQILEDNLQKYYKNGEKPVFVITHEPPYDTVLKSEYEFFTELRKILNKYAQVINISGHTHSPVFLDRMIWQGEFTAVNAGSLFYWKDDPFGNASRKLQSCDALIFEVYESQIIIRRFDMHEMHEFSPFNFPLPFDSNNPLFSPELRSKLFESPEFPQKTAEVRFDDIPFNEVFFSVSTPQPSESFHRMRVELFEKQNGTMQSVATFDQCNTYRNMSEKFIINIPAGIVKGNKKYHAKIYAMNIYNAAGTAVEIDFTAPECALQQLPFDGITGILKEDGTICKTTEFSTEHEMEQIHILLPQELKDHRNKKLYAVMELECEHENNPAILMAHGTLPDYGRHYFPRGKVPKQRHSFKLDHLNGDKLSVFLGEGSPGKYKIHDVKYYK